MLSGGDVWDAGSAASSAAAFASVLAAIVLIVNTQLAQREDIRRSLSRRLAPIALVMLLLAAYEFVLLSGEFSVKDGLAALESAQTSSPPKNAGPALLQRLKAQARNLQIVEEQVRTTAPLFSLAGSLLAMGAVMAVATIVVAIEEALGSRDPVTRLAFYIGIATTILLTLFGFQDAVNNLGSNLGASSWWWIIHILAVTLPILVVRRWFPGLNIGGELRQSGSATAPGTFSLMSPSNTITVTGILVAYIFVPALAYLLVSNGAIRADLVAWTGYITLASSFWFGCGVGLLVHALESFNPAGPSIDLDVS